MIKKDPFRCVSDDYKHKLADHMNQSVQDYYTTDKWSSETITVSEQQRIETEVAIAKQKLHETISREKARKTRREALMANEEAFESVDNEGIAALAGLLDDDDLPAVVKEIIRRFTDTAINEVDK